MGAPRIDEVARLIGDPSRAAMLDALMDGRAWTGCELARAAHVATSTASEHLQRLVSGALLGVVAQGRHRYYRIASPEVARTIEALSLLASRQPAQRSGRGIDADLRRARTCYDHLAGALGVALADALRDCGAIALGPSGGAITPAGRALFAAHGIDLDVGSPRRAPCRPCLDWSERRLHVAGGAGAAIAAHAFAHGWVSRRQATRAVTVTELGTRALRETFGLDWRP